MLENNENENNITKVSESTDIQTLPLRWEYLFLSVIPIVCIVGNSMVIIAVWRTKNLQTPTNYLLVSLSIADLIVGAFAMPFHIYISVSFFKLSACYLKHL